MYHRNHKDLGHRAREKENAGNKDLPKILFRF